MVLNPAFAELLDTLEIAACEFDEGLRTMRWNATFLDFFPEHAGQVHAGEPYADNLRRFYASRLGVEEMPDLERYVADGVARHLHQQQPFAFTHHGRRMMASSLPMPGGGRVRIWKEIGAAPAEDRPPAIPPFDALDYVADGACVTGRDGRILASNESFRHLYDVPSGQGIVGRTLEEVFSAAWPGFPPLSAMAALLRNGLRYDGAPLELELPRDRWRRVITRHTENGHAYTLHSDITAQKRQQRELLAAQEALREANEELLRLSSEDALTQLPNRRAFDSALGATQGQATLLIIDVDHFKAVNDEHGHPVGDACLRRIAASIASCTREVDSLPARIGGEEFAVLLRGGDLSLAMRVAEAIRMAVAREDWAGLVGRAVTVSIGIGLGDASGLQAAADRALYAAKRLGRNRVEIDCGEAERASA